MGSLKAKDNFERRPHRQRKDAHEARREREARAIEVIKAMRKSPSAPEPQPGPPLPTRLLGEKPEAGGDVYFAYCAGRIKIGYSRNVAMRMAHLATHSPQPVVLLLTIRGTEEDEAAYHEMFAADRVNLEWFHLSYELRCFLESKFEGETFGLLFGSEIDFLEAAMKDTAYTSELLKDLEEENRNHDGNL